MTPPDDALLSRVAIGELRSKVPLITRRRTPVWAFETAQHSVMPIDKVVSQSARAAPCFVLR